MSFVSWNYPVFLLSFLVVFWRLPHRPRLWFLLAASYFFYAAWDWRFLALIFTTTGVDYLCALGLAGERRPLGQVLLLALLPPAWLTLAFFLPGSTLPFWVPLTAAAVSLVFIGFYRLLWLLPQGRQRRGFLFLSLGVCLAVLFFFKYFNFFLDSAARLLSLVGWQPHLPTLQIILPVGLSFYTFQSLGYVIDVYRGQGPVCRDFLVFAVFDAFFPQLVAGPIERGRQLLPQLEQERPFSLDYVAAGLPLLLVGYFKKVFVADNCALVANYVFAPETPLTGFWALLGSLAFAAQIYGDFSGYTDIARGSAKLLGIELVENFRFPYLAQNPSDFWARWHISLSSWFRDYVYIPLGGNRGSRWQTSRNLLLTLIIAGLWHGAAWTFVLWGLYHGLLLILYRFGPLAGLNRREFASPLVRMGAVALMFIFTLFGWAIFRSPDLARLGAWLTALGTWGPPELSWSGPAGWLALHILPLLGLQWLTRRQLAEARLEQLSWPVRGLVYVGLAVLTVSSAAHDQEFIYFQF